MKRKFNKLAKQFREQGYNTSVTEANGVLTLSIWCRDHKPGDIATDVYYDIESCKITMANELQLMMEL